MKKLFSLLIPILLTLILSVGAVSAQKGATNIAYGQTVNGAIGSGQLNLWSFQGNAGDLVEVSLVSQNFDAFLVLSDSAGNFLVSDDDSGAGLNSYISSFQLPWSGVFSLQVSSTTNVGGSYLLSLGRIQPALPPRDMYTNNFDYEVGYPEWGYAPAGITPTGRRFLGPFLNDSVMLNLNNLPPHTNVRVTFDLFIIKSWDGNETMNGVGPDIFDMRQTRDAYPLIHTSFSNVEYSAQTYPNRFGDDANPPRTGAAEINSLGYGEFGDAVYPMSVDFAHSNPWLSLSFTGQNLEFLANEAWGLDNVRVTVRSVPQYGPLQLCVGTFPSSIRSGMVAHNPIVTPLRAWPQNAAITYQPLSAYTSLSVLDGPECVEGQVWWHVTIGSSNLLGWIREYEPTGQLLLDRTLGTEVNPINWVRLADFTPQIESMATGLNVRDSPSVNTGSRMFSITRGLAYNVVGRTQNGIWYQIQSVRNNATVYGWVCGHPLTRRNFATEAVPPVYYFTEDVTSHLSGTLVPNEDCSGKTYP